MEYLQAVVLLRNALALLRVLEHSGGIGCTSTSSLELIKLFLFQCQCLVVTISVMIFCVKIASRISRLNASHGSHRPLASSERSGELVNYRDWPSLHFRLLKTLKRLSVSNPDFTIDKSGFELVFTDGAGQNCNGSFSISIEKVVCLLPFGSGSVESQAFLLQQVDVAQCDALGLFGKSSTAGLCLRLRVGHIFPGINPRWVAKISCCFSLLIRPIPA